MTKRDKRFRKLLNRPKSVTCSEIESVLLELEFEKIEAKGSHKKFKHSVLKSDLIIPVHNNDCKEFYKKQIAKLLKKHF